MIINSKHNIAAELEYYKKTYNDDLEHRYASGIRIIGFVHGYSFSGIQRDLGLSVE